MQQPSRWRALLLPAIACLTLGLAPFVPEPHIVGKIRWVWGGAIGMHALDWADLALHGAPFVWLLVTLARVARAPKVADEVESDSP